MRRRYVGMSDSDWEAHKAALRERTAQALASGAYRFAESAKTPKLVVVSDPDGCPTYCPECHGENIVYFTEDGVEYARPCSRYQERKDIKNGKPKY